MPKLPFSNKFTPVKLTLDHTIKPFDCGNDDLNGFLMNDAKTHVKYLNHTTYLFETDSETIAYFSLANDLLRIDSVEDFMEDLQYVHLDAAYWEYFFSRNTFPAMKLGRLAIHRQYQRQGYGTLILDYLQHDFSTNSKTGCQFITVDALNQGPVLLFYEVNGFNLLTIRDCNYPTRQMYKCLL